ncbi:WD40 repeat domain-containing protein [Ktedonospora formicarum]|uniref:Translation initiation factor beta propellor-like domain-containing protein n=1 Tax=Ktedonospora formicarum TaxID=2778364 RepID=A0A8J3I513_9CHLR|nr:WD40 repeat domain-containing protein [Ktedonospora formicarum]GHO46785.1 hypothetical protein KSX_49480 [Ktedonospora formicarum]
MDWSANGHLEVSFNTLGIFDGTTCATKLQTSLQGTNALWSPDHTRLLNISSTNFPQIVDASTGKVLATYIPTEQAKGCCGGSGYIAPFAFAWSGNGTQIISLTGSQQSQWSVEIWSASTGKVVSKPLTQNGTPNFIQLSPSGKYVAVSDKSGIAIWSIDKKKQIGHLSLNVDSQHAPLAWAWSPDGKYLAESNSEIHLWDVHAKKFVAIFGKVSNKNWISNLAWSKDSIKLAASISTPPDWTKNTVNIWKIS